MMKRYNDVARVVTFCEAFYPDNLLRKQVCIMQKSYKIVHVQFKILTCCF